MFRFTRKPSSGSQNQYLAKITHLVQSAYVELVQDVSVIAVYCDLQGVCTYGDTLPHTVVGVCGEFQRTGRFLQRGI